MPKKITLTIISLLFLAGCTSGNYVWEDKDLQKLYANIEWKPISIKKLAGFGLENLSEKKTEKCIDNYDTPYLRTEGGMCGIGYWLEITKENEIVKIDSLEKLKTQVLPLDTEAEAISFLSVISSDLEKPNEIPTGKVATIEDGYLVQLIHKNTFGCGTHQPTGEIVKISKETGEIKYLAFEKEPFSLEPEMCID